MPSPIANFAGAQNTNNAVGVAPPDTNGAVGPSNYVQMVNLVLTIFDKTGTKLLGPVPSNTLWSGFGGVCQTHNDGDPVVLYDQLSDRWMISQFALTSTSSDECIAISQTGDPTGAWFRYDFPYSTTVINDYPKFGVWPDAYYMSANQFSLSTQAWRGTGVVAYERARMLQGLSARAIYIDLGANSSTSSLSSWLPADLEGSTPPPAGAPNHYLTIQGTSLGDPADRLQQWDFHVDWTTPANSTFTQKAVLPVAAFNANVCGFARSCIPQPGTTAKLDAISDRLMFRNAYRNFGSHEAEVVDHSVNVGPNNQVGIRWYEIRNTSSAPALFQQGTYAGDTANTASRWMGSVALDGSGDIGLGYSVASSTVFPSIRYVGRLVGDPAGTLPQGETTLIAGTGSQTLTNSRWGDYSNMTVDPSDDCTFWYTQEYYAANGNNWQTRVGSFRFPSCGSSSPPVNISPPTIGGAAVQGQTLTGSIGAWTGNPPPTFTFEWDRCDTSGSGCVAIAGQTGTSYVLVQADVGSTIRFAVTGTNTSGSSAASSAQTAVVVASIGPTTPVLDAFNRANGGAGSNWSLLRPTGFATMNVSNNAAVDSSSTLFAANFWNPATFGPDAEAYATVAALGASDNIRIGARIVNAGTTSSSGYYVQISSTGVWSILRIDAGPSTTLATGPTQPLINGDKVMIRIVGSVITALRFTGGNWAVVMSYDTAGDATRYTAAGRIAIQLKTSTIDDFGGGSI